MSGYLLDTNVVSELVRPAPRTSVVDWIASESPRDLHIASVTLGELVRGTIRLPDGRRREALERWVLDDLRQQFEGRILPFDDEAAVIWGTIMGDGDRRGRPRVVRRDRVQFMLRGPGYGALPQPNRTLDPHAWDAYVYVCDADSLHAEFARRGAEIVRPPEDQDYGCRDFEVRDPDGYIICFGQDLEGPTAGDAGEA